MDYFNKLSGFIQSPSGFEWVLLKKIPHILLLTSLPPCAVMFNLYFFNDTINAEQFKTIYQCLGILFSLWFFIGTVTIGCIVVIVMKGPAYVADPYELPQENKSLETHQDF